MVKSLDLFNPYLMAVAMVALVLTSLATYNFSISPKILLSITALQTLQEH